MVTMPVQWRNQERLTSKVYCCHMADQDSNPDSESPCLLCACAPSSHLILSSHPSALSIQMLMLITLNVTQELCIVSMHTMGNHLETSSLTATGSSITDYNFSMTAEWSCYSYKGGKADKARELLQRSWVFSLSLTCSAKVSPTPKSATPKSTSSKVILKKP